MEKVVTIESLTAALVVITAIYAYLTYRMAAASEKSVKAAEDHLEATLRPYIVIRPYIRPTTNFLYLSIVNSGASAASELRLQLDRDFYQFGESKRTDQNLRNSSAFSLPISSFAPGQELHFGLGQGWIIFGKQSDAAVTPPEFTISASYSFRGRSFEEKHRIDLRPYASSEENRDPVVEELEKIRKTLTELVAAQQAVQRDGPAPGGSTR